MLRQAIKIIETYYEHSLDVLEVTESICKLSHTYNAVSSREPAPFTHGVKGRRFGGDAPGEVVAPPWCFLVFRAEARNARYLHHRNNRGFIDSGLQTVNGTELFSPPALYDSVL